MHTFLVFPQNQGPQHKVKLNANGGLQHQKDFATSLYYLIDVRSCINNKKGTQFLITSQVKSEQLSEFRSAIQINIICRLAITNNFEGEKPLPAAWGYHKSISLSVICLQQLAIPTGVLIRRSYPYSPDNFIRTS